MGRGRRYSGMVDLRERSRPSVREEQSVRYLRQRTTGDGAGGDPKLLPVETLHHRSHNAGTIEVGRV